MLGRTGSYHQSTSFSRLGQNLRCDSLTLTTIKQIITVIHKDNHAIQKRETEPVTTYVVRDVPHKEYMKLHRLEPLFIPLEECTICSRSDPHTGTEDAFQHLLRYHTQGIPNEENPTRYQLTHWIASSFGADLEKRNERMIELLSALRWRVDLLRSKAIDIRYSVANKNNEKPSDYLLPLALVKAAEKTFQMVYTAQYSFESLHKASANEATLTTELETQMALLQYLGSAASTALSEARHALVLQAHTGDDQTSAINIRSTPESTLLGCFIHLSERSLFKDMCALELYHDHLSSMVRAFSLSL
jgi:hypothetical protein